MTDITLVAEKGAYLSFTVQRDEDSAKHLTTVDSDALRTFCDCMGFWTRGKCFHVKAVLDKLVGEGKLDKEMSDRLYSDGGRWMVEERKDFEEAFGNGEENLK